MKWVKVIAYINIYTHLFKKKVCKENDNIAADLAREKCLLDKYRFVWFKGEYQSRGLSSRKLTTHIILKI